MENLTFNSSEDQMDITQYKVGQLFFLIFTVNSFIFRWITNFRHFFIMPSDDQIQCTRRDIYQRDDIRRYKNSEMKNHETSHFPPKSRKLIRTKICWRYSTIETKEAVGIGYNLHLSANAEKETRYIQYGQLILFQ